MQPRSRRSGPRRPPRSHPLTREHVLRTALAVLDREGIEALGMRRVAEELGVTPMALYKHVPAKRALEQGIAELIASELDALPDSRRPWPERLRACARWVRRGCLAHPNALPLVERAEQPSALVLRVMEVALGALEDAGFAPRRAIEAYCTLIGFTMGHVGYQLRGPLRPQRSRASGSRTAVVVADYPAAARTLIVRGWDIDAAFEFGLDTIVDGLKTRLRRGSAGQKRG